VLPVMPALAGIFGPFPGTPPTDIGPQAGGGLQQCPKTPNCFSSSAPTDDSHYVAPFPYNKSTASAVADVKAIIASYPTDLGECGSARIRSMQPHPYPVCSHHHRIRAPVGCLCATLRSPLRMMFPHRSLSRFCALALSLDTGPPVAMHCVEKLDPPEHGAPTSTPVWLEGVLLSFTAPRASSHHLENIMCPCLLPVCIITALPLVF
jgi:hypothetical protein